MTETAQDTRAGDSAIGEKLRGRRILVTGAGGMLGSHVVDTLASLGAEVLAVDVRQSPIGFGHASFPNVIDVQADITDRTMVADVLDGCDSAVHLAAVLTKRAEDRPTEALMVNTVATHQLLQEGAMKGVRRVVLASSGAVYGVPRQDGHPLSETDPLLARSFYAVSKIASEMYAEAFSRTTGLEFMALRLGTMYGPRLGRGGVVASYLHKLLGEAERGLTPSIPGTPQETRDLIFVKDAAQYVARSLVSEESNVALNIASGAPTTNEELFTTALEICGKPTAIDWIPRHSSLPPHGRTYSRTRTNDVLGVFGLTKLANGLQQFIDWRSHLEPSVLAKLEPSSSRTDDREGKDDRKNEGIE